MQTSSKAPTARSQKAKAARQVGASFEEAARALECDESEERFNAALGKIARHKPEAGPPKPTKNPKVEKPAE